MRLKFIGTDGSMGLEYGKVYDCQIESIAPYVYVTWIDWERAVQVRCPYSSLRALLANWEEI